MHLIVGQLIAGLGLFFYGLNTVSSNLQQLSSRRFRTLIARFTDRAWMGGLVGFLAGALTQSTTAVTIVLANMNASGLVTVQRALPIVAWANVGTCVLIFITVLDIRLVFLYLLGICGIANVFTRQPTRKSLVGTGLGIGLLLFGMGVVKENAVALSRADGAHELLVQLQNAYLLALAGGTLVAFLTQSTTAAILIALALVNAGVLGVDDTIMAIYGGNIGSTFARMALATWVKGSSRQVGRFQDLLKLGGCLIFTILFYLETYGGVPLVRALVEAMAGQVATQMALVNLFFNLGMACLLTVMMPSVRTLLDRLWPALSTEDLATAEHLHPQSLADPETALDLAAKEQARLIGRLPSYLSALRTLSGQTSAIDIQDVHRAFGLLWAEVDSFLTTLLHLPLAPKSAARVTNVHNRNGVIRLLEETIHHLVVSVQAAPRSERLNELVDNFIEALDFILLTAGDAATGRDAADAKLLAGLCADRGELMGKLRALYLSGEHDLGPQDKSLLLDLTTSFDRTVWMLGRYAGLVEQERMAG